MKNKKDITEKEFYAKLKKHLDKTIKNVFTIKVVPAHRKKLRLMDFAIGFKIVKKEIYFSMVDFVVQDNKFYHIKDFLEMEVKPKK